MSLFRRRMMMVSKQEPDTPQLEFDYLTIIPLHDINEEYRIYPYGGGKSQDQIYQELPFYYRINGGNWIEVMKLETEEPVFSIFLTKDTVLQLKCNGVDYTGDAIASQRFHIYSEASHNLSGTPMSIIYGDDFNNCNYVPEGALDSMFKDNIGLRHIVNPKTFLPCKKMDWSCYYNLFYGCKNLINAPELPATTLASFCYGSMFRECTSLVNAPELPATSLVSGCYESMFENCSQLKYVKADCLNIGDSYSKSWLTGVSSYGIFVKNPDATWNDVGDSAVPSDWHVVTEGTSPENLITFKIDGNSYMAEKGMTWGEYIDSMYNLIYAYVDGDKVWTSKGYVGLNASVKVVLSDVIIDGYVYVWNSDLEW